MLKKASHKDGQDGIVVIKKTEPGMCGGTDAVQDTTAPKEILSEDMIFFDVSSELNTDYIDSDKDESCFDDFSSIHAFAVPAGRGAFLFLEKSKFNQNTTTRSWAFVKKNDIFASLVKLVRECKLAKENGFHSETHGLPKNFGGRIDIRYKGGERISVCDNQTPVISFEAGCKTAKIFIDAMNGEQAELPDVSLLKSIHFYEDRMKDGFSKSTLTIESDGTGTIQKSARYTSGNVYNNEIKVDVNTVSGIKKTINECGIFAWEQLPDSGFKHLYKKQLKFVFSDMQELTVTGDKLLPYQIGNGFFQIECELTTKH